MEAEPHKEGKSHRGGASWEMDSNGGSDSLGTPPAFCQPNDQFQKPR